MVSIPHRYSKNEDFVLPRPPLSQVSIPHRYSKNPTRLVKDGDNKKSFNSS